MVESTYLETIHFGAILPASIYTILWCSNRKDAREQVRTILILLKNHGACQNPTQLGHAQGFSQKLRSNFSPSVAIAYYARVSNKCVA